jgi:hypothetical protein
MKTLPAAIAILLAVMSTGAAFALDEVAYGVAKEPWTEGLGNHRAIVRVEQKTDAVLVRIPWRRRDRDPKRKQILVMDATTGQRITNIARLHLDRFEGALVFQPQTAPGDYFVYYLPFVPEPNWGSYNHDYLPPQETAASDWKARLPAETERLPRAAVVRLEARTEFDSFYPMEVVATPEETQQLLDRSAAVPSRAPAESAYMLFPEDRRFPIRMTDELPLRWVKSGPGKEFHDEAQRNEFYVFQIGVWAARTNLTEADVEFSGEIARWLNCFNTGGTNWDGKPFHKTINVPHGRVQALWIGVDVPRDAKPGEHAATVIIRPTNAAPASVEIKLKVLPTELTDRGDGEPSLLTRLRWLNSTLGSDEDALEPAGFSAFPPYPITDPGTPSDGRFVSLGSGRTAEVIRQIWFRNRRSLRWIHESPSSAEGIREIWPRELDLLSAPIRFQLSPSGLTGGLQDAEGRIVGSPLEATNNIYFLGGSNGPISWHSKTQVEPDGHVACRFRLQAASPFQATNLLLSIPVQIKLKNTNLIEAATYFMGIGLPAGRTPTNYTWRWEGPYNSFWIGNAHAGLHVKLLGSSYEGPMQNLYHPKPPTSWFNDGKGGVTITNGPKGEVLVQAFTGPFDLKAGEERSFDFSLLVTPVKPLDTATHFRERYWHSTHDIPGDVNVINVHHATTPNPFINYPFLAVDKLREFCHTNQAAGKKVKIYYTVRELTTHLPELWALRSLGDEVLADGPGGGFPWLREHLGGNYTTAWYNVAEGGVVDAAILTSGASRWYNFYVEGINWLACKVPIDGLYLDDVAYDRTILRRVRRVLDRARFGCLIDLHSNTLFSKGPANQYTEFFPYVNRLWFGEGFDYEAMSPEQWLVECSGIPFGLMGDMLQDGGNRWRGMLFGMTARLPWANSDPRPVWKLWDEFGIGEARMMGWWESDCPIRTGRADVLATAYVKPGKTLVALASWAPEKTDVRLQVDWKALGVDANKARLVAPEVKDFQPAKMWRADEPITVEPKRGWLIYVAE